ncbi:transmembrane protein 41A-A-like [Daphnia pulicaria]|uniref:transmembrane protein 41A-A-like n=1 Tax=Daphnia pulicaria TaxID=35523 RepID=UPI001EEC6E84|nr:transmembrane protein 41A-A-like [Daphnia pulicaria]
MGSLLYLPVIWLAATSWLLLMTTFFVPDSVAIQNFKDMIKFPCNLEELKSLTGTLLEFQKFHPLYVYILFCSAYLYKQTFAIPGSVFLNLLAGALYGTLKGTCLASLLTATGASMCYFLSLLTGSDFILNTWPEKMSHLRAQVDNNQERLPYFLLSLRLVPVSPNWFINVTSPILGIPIKTFAATAFLGLMPYNFMCVKAGSVLSELISVNDLLNFQMVCNLIIVAGVASLPGFLNKKLQKMS